MTERVDQIASKAVAAMLAASQFGHVDFDMLMPDQIRGYIEHYIEAAENDLRLEEAAAAHRERELAIDGWRDWYQSAWAP